MRSRLAVLALIAGVLAGCTSDDSSERRSMPDFDDHRVEQINSTGR
jgi:type IV pilus biogenesis protein CpaD/CtpE